VAAKGAISEAEVSAKRYTAHSSHGERVHSVHQILPRVSDSFEVELTNHHKYGGGNVLHRSRFTATQSMRFQSKITFAVDHSFDPTAKGIEMQWQDYQQN